MSWFIIFLNTSHGLVDGLHEIQVLKFDRVRNHFDVMHEYLMLGLGPGLCVVLYGTGTGRGMGLHLILGVVIF